MGKGKKKKANNGKKKKADKRTEDDTNVDDSSTWVIPEEQYERARLAAANRTEDPLKNWTRLQNDECPICMLPLPFKPSDTKYCVTCGATVCMGCVIGTVQAHIRDGKGAEKAMEKAATCPYCRSDTAKYDDKYGLDQEMKRVNAGNAETMCHLGEYYFDGEMGLRQDKVEGLKWYHRAVEAGSGDAAFALGRCYKDGDGVEKDMEKAMEYFQKSAELDFVLAFAVIGHLLISKDEIEQGMLNVRKAAICGVTDESIFNLLRDGFQCGVITKDEYAYTLRENQAACNEMKSDGRECWKRCNTSR